MKRMQAEYRKLRSAAHADERAEFERLSRDPTFRHFLALCISERAASDIGPIEIRIAQPPGCHACRALAAAALERPGRLPAPVPTRDRT